MQSMRLPLTFALAAILSLSPSSTADESLAGIACRSVHLWYPAPEGVTFYNEMSVDQSADGTYFMACGFHMGYYGIQELGNGKKLVIFSVWDPGAGNDPKAVAADKQVKILYKDDKVRAKRFGGEGTGGQSFFDYDWKIGQTYRFLVKAKPDGDRTAFSAYFYIPEDKQWKHLVTFSTLTKGQLLGGYYSFVEDFKRDRVSATKARKAHYGNGWVQGKDAQWTALSKARFTADNNPSMNINSAVDGERFFLITGGETKNTDTKLRETMTRPGMRTRPTDLPE